MKATVYLSSLHQDLIDGVRTVDQFKALGDPQAWTLCCDGFCCILDFSKFQDPLDLVARKKNWTKWYVRREEGGGLLWNPDTNRVFELDEEAFKVLMTLQEGTGLEKAVREHGLQATELYGLLAQISEAGEHGKAVGKKPRGA